MSIGAIRILLRCLEVKPIFCRADRTNGTSGLRRGEGILLSSIAPDRGEQELSFRKIRVAKRRSEAVAVSLPPLKGEIGFDQYVITCVLSRALEEVEAGEATATEVPDFAD